MKTSRAVPPWYLYLISVSIIAGSLGSGFVLGLWPSWRWVNEQMHSTIKAVAAVGAVAAVAISWLLLQGRREQGGETVFLVAMAFLGMGLLHGFNVICSQGQAFIFLHSVAGLAGGVGFALAWRPEIGRYASGKKWAPWTVAGGAALIGLWAFVWPETLPAMVHNGELTRTATSINVLAGVLYLAAGIRFILDFHRSNKMEMLLLAGMALMFGAAGLVVRYAVHWDNGWLVWHILRVAAYLAVLGFLVCRHQRIRQELHRPRDKLKRLGGERTAELTTGNEMLQRGTGECRAAEERIEHFNLVLRAVRNVNQLIVKETDRGRLLQGVCENLVETRGCFSALIALLDDSGNLMATFEAGLAEDILLKVEPLESVTGCPGDAGEPMNPGTSRGLGRRYVWTTYLQPSQHLIAQGLISLRLEHADRVYGLLSLTVPPEIVGDSEEYDLFRDVAGDIAFALHSIELEEVRKQTQDELVRRRAYLEKLVGERTAELTQANRVTQAMNEIFQEALTVEADEHLGRTCLSVAQRLTESRFGVYLEMDANRALVTTAISNPGWDECDMPVADVHRAKKNVEIKEIERAIVREGKSRIVHADKVPTRSDRCSVSDGHPEITAFLGVPLKRQGKTIGMLGLGNKDGGYELSDQHAVESLSVAIVEAMNSKRAELKLRSAQAELLSKERLAVLGQLSGGVGHELRNPLGAIKNAAFFLNMALEQPDPEVKETLQILEREVGTCERIISSLLDFARQKPPVRRKTDINELLQAALARTPVPDSINVKDQLDETLPALLADPDQLSQVFGNIILNAVQAMTDGGSLVVKSATRGRQEVAVSVTDTGVGIPQEAMAKLCEPLFTTKAKGIGLGLAVTTTLVEAHGGTIDVQSEESKGSTFTVRLPVGKVNESQDG